VIECSLLCGGVRVGTGAKISPGCVLAYDVVIPAHVKVPPLTKLYVPNAKRQSPSPAVALPVPWEKWSEGTELNIENNETRMWGLPPLPHCELWIGWEPTEDETRGPKKSAGKEDQSASEEEMEEEDDEDLDYDFSFREETPSSASADANKRAQENAKESLASSKDSGKSNVPTRAPTSSKLLSTANTEQSDIKRTYSSLICVHRKANSELCRVPRRSARNGCTRCERKSSH